MIIINLIPILKVNRQKIPSFLSYLIVILSYIETSLYSQNSTPNPEIQGAKHAFFQSVFNWHPNDAQKPAKPIKSTISQFNDLSVGNGKKPGQSYFSFFTEKRANYIDEIYECVVTALDQLRRYGFISKAFGRPVFLTVNASVVVDEEGMIEIAKRLNGEENCKDYIENIEAFY